MGIGTTSGFNAIALTARHLRAIPSTRALRFTLGWAIMLGGTFLLFADLGAATIPLLHDVFDAIRRAMA
jgi:hypothetical protein